jgi:hypothetical protein
MKSTRFHYIIYFSVQYGTSRQADRPHIVVLRISCVRMNTVTSDRDIHVCSTNSLRSVESNKIHNQPSLTLRIMLQLSRHVTLFCANASTFLRNRHQQCRFACRIAAQWTMRPNKFMLSLHDCRIRSSFSSDR